jgi:hypothetical protein
MVGRRGEAPLDPPYKSIPMSRPLPILALLLAAGVGSAADQSKTAEQWGVFELTLAGPATGNPFTDVELSATFRQGTATVRVPGFYDGDGTYRVRFLPPTRGEWAYQTASNRPELARTSGSFTATPPAAGNHGPVRVRDTFHFAYADSTPYCPVGTTCYAWNHQGDPLEEQTLAALKAGPFNKIRMCVFPKWYAFNKVEPKLYPFAGTPPNRWDYTRFDPAFFRHLEKRIADLRDLGIEADLILFHPYDEGHWGFDRMAAEHDDRYLRYVVARLAAYRNVWWSLANEYDFMKEKKASDWDRFLSVVTTADPFGHLCSIHNGTKIFNQTDPRLTHASIQNGSAVAGFGRAVQFRDLVNKPVVFDEVKYEGDFPQRWGNLSAVEMLRRCWHGTVDGTYVGHGETYKHPQDVVWWARGGTLRGQSPARIGFLRKVIEDAPAPLDPLDKWQDERTAGKRGEYYLVYFGAESPAEWVVDLPRAKWDRPLKLKAEILDTWEMTVTPVPGEFAFEPGTGYRMTPKGDGTIKLPGKPDVAVRLRAVGGYAETAAKRAADAVAAAGLADPAAAKRAERVVAAHYDDLHEIHEKRNAAVKAAAADKEKVEAARADADAEVAAMHARFKADLAAGLTPAQVEAVEDKMTYNVVPITFKGYQQMLPALTDAQKATVLDLLKQGREAALVAGSSEAKHAAFNQYKGKIGNYLSGQGYDLKKAGQEWAERRKTEPKK